MYPNGEKRMQGTENPTGHGANVVISDISTDAGTSLASELGEYVSPPFSFKMVPFFFLYFRYQ
jgi:hypothetical protein